MPGGRPGVTDAIAIIGMSGRFPGAPTIDRFWENLRHGVESMTPLSQTQLRASGVHPAALDNPSFVPVGSVLEDIDLFDAAFFGFSPREAESLDPQQRLFLETSWHALEDAGYDPAAFPGQVGVYGGCAMSTYLAHLESNPEFMALLGYLQVHIGNDKDYLATRVSYELNLTGPSFSIQTACSTSLLAVAVAGDHLLSHQCDMALAGGVCVRVPQHSGYYYEPGGIFSPDGHCRVFDEQAAGVVFGNGVGAVVLRRLSDAIADGDAIRAVVRGWAVNNDGASKASYAAPSLEGQAAVIAAAHQHAGVSPDTISYVEAHGTGTPVGDPIEIGALTKAFRTSTDRQGFCAVGSVKTNIGHLDPAAGVASLIKTVLALERGEVPPTLNCQTVNPAIDLAGSPFYINTELSDWTSLDGPRRAGVSGFGIGGTNVHLVLEEAPAPATTGRADHRGHHLLVLSARSSSALSMAIENLAEHLTLHGEATAAEIAFTMQAGRRAMEHRCAVVYEDVDDLVAALGATDSGRVMVSGVPFGDPSVAFMFSGQGTQYVNMASGLYTTEPAFRAHLDRCCDHLKAEMGIDLRAMLFPAEEDLAAARDGLTRTAVAQPALFAVEYAIARLWMDWGVRPDLMIGHSIGEYVAACLAEVFSVEDGLTLVAERGRLMQGLPTGSMLAVPMSEEELEPVVGNGLDLAAVNEARLCVVSGPTPHVLRLQARLAQRDIVTQRLHTSHAFHSRMMDEILEAYADRVGTLSLSVPRIPVISNLTGAPLTAAQATSPEYWARHLRRPVRFAAGLAQLVGEARRVLVEVGPGQTLCSFARRHPDRADGQVVLPSLRRHDEERADGAVLTESLGRLWLAGVGVDWTRVHASETPRRAHLPVYPFERRRYWADVDDGGAAGPPLILKEPDIADWFYAPSWEYTLAPRPRRPDVAAGTWVVFDDDGDLGAQVTDRLLGEGHAVTRVRRGTAFAVTGDGAFTIDPTQASHFRALFERLAGDGLIPQSILNLWSVGVADRGLTDSDVFGHWQSRGFYSLLYTVQALLAVRVTTPVQIVMASTDVHAVTGDDRVCPAKAPLLAACRAIPQQYPHIACRAVDIERRRRGRRHSAQAAAQLVAEFADESMPPTVAYRKGQRWLQTFEPMPIDDSDRTSYPLRRRGVYLITGGLGRIGLSLAQELASAVRARLVLVGRSTLPDRGAWDDWVAGHDADDPVSLRIGRVRAIEDHGGTVVIANADVADATQLQEVVDETFRRFGRLDGVIHGAGNVTAAGFFAIDEARPDLCDRQFETKVLGLLALEKVLRHQELDFVVLLSSISSVLAGLGYVAYSAGNAFMDSFAQSHDRVGATRWISIDWDTWEFEDSGGWESDATRLSLHPAEGVDAFRRILSWVELPQIVVSTGWLPARIDQWVDLRSLRRGIELRNREAERFHSRPDLLPTHVAPRTPLERVMVEIWEDTLGVRPVGVIDNFFTDLGGNSLLATQLISRLRVHFEIDIPLRSFFDAPTIDELLRVVGAQREQEPAVGADREDSIGEVIA